MVSRAGGRSTRERLLPRTALGMAAFVLSGAIGAAFSGAVLYSYYEYRLQKTNDRVNTLITTYQKEFQSAQGDLANQTATDKAEIDKELGPLAASGTTLQSLDKQVAPSMFFVSTKDQSGQPSVGSAFAIASDSGQTLLLTSYTTIAAATMKPGPPVTVQQGGGGTTTVTVFDWDPATDLALIILPKGNTPALQPAPASPGPQIGDRIYSVAGIGALGAEATQGSVSDVSSSGLQHTAPIGPAFQGGPLVNAQGQVVAVSSRGYAPLNFSTDSVWFAPLIRAACNRVLSCPNGTLGGAGQSG